MCNRSCGSHVHEYLVYTVLITGFLERMLPRDHFRNDRHRSARSGCDRTRGQSAGRWLLTPCPGRGRTQACRTDLALPPLRGCRATSLLAPRAERAWPASLPTLSKLRRAGSPSRAASKRARRQALACSGMHEIAPTGLHESGTLAVIVPKRLL